MPFPHLGGALWIKQWCFIAKPKSHIEVIMAQKTDFKCEDCGGKDLLLPTWRTQGSDGFAEDRGDFPDSFDLNGDAWCIDCNKIIFVEL